MKKVIDRGALIIESLPYAYARHKIITDSKGHPSDYIFLEVNSAFEEATGLKWKNISGRKVTEVLPGIEKDAFNWIDFYGKVALGGESATFHQFSEPLQRYYEIKAYSDEKGYFTTVFNDITARIKAEEALRHQNNRLQLLLEISKAMAAEKKVTSLTQVIIDGITKLTSLNSAAFYLLQGNQLRLEATYPPLPADFPEKLRLAPLEDHPHIGRAVATRQPVVLADSRKAELTAAEKGVCDLRQLRSNLYVPLVYKGSSLGVLIVSSINAVHEFTEEEIAICQTLAGNAALALTERGHIEAQQRYIADIEEKNRELEQAEIRVRQSKHRVADILRHAENVAFVTTDCDLPEPRILDFSYGAEQIFGYKKEEVLGKEVSILHNPEDVRQFPAVIDQMKNNQAGFSGEVMLVRKGGEHFPALFKTHPLFTEKGEMWGTFGVSIDISDRKQAEKEVERTLAVYRRGLEGIISSMGTLMGKRDNYTAHHQLRVAQLAGAIAKELGLEEHRVKGVELAAEVHDIGKIGIPAEILTKPWSLTDLEYSILQTHPQTGYEILQNIDFPWPLAETVLQHHEKVDGSGYPAGLRGDEILLEAKIIGAADVVEAMASDRPYRPAKGLDAALAELERQRGIFFEGSVVDACLRLFREKGFDFTGE